MNTIMMMLMDLALRYCRAKDELYDANNWDDKILDSKTFWDDRYARFRQSEMVNAFHALQEKVTDLVEEKRIALAAVENEIDQFWHDQNATKAFSSHFGEAWQFKRAAWMAYTKSETKEEH